MDKFHDSFSYSRCHLPNLLLHTLCPKHGWQVPLAQMDHLLGCLTPARTCSRCLYNIQNCLPLDTQPPSMAQNQRFVLTNCSWWDWLLGESAHNVIIPSKWTSTQSQPRFSCLMVDLLLGSSCLHTISADQCRLLIDTKSWTNWGDDNIRSSRIIFSLRVARIKGWRSCCSWDLWGT